MRHFLLLVSAWAAFAQSITIGVTGGGRGTDDMSGAAISESKRYVVGPAFELGLPLGLGVEADALYRRDGYRSGWGNWAGSSFDRARLNSWEFPMLLTYRVPVPVVKPFAEVGYAPRVGSGTVDSNVLALFPTQSYQQVHYSATWQTGGGLVVGGGVRLGLGRLRLSPQVRYTHWNNAAVSGYYSDGPSYQSMQNQVDVLLSIGWKMR